MPDMPIDSRTGPGAGILGYTWNVGAFARMQQGGQIMIITYNGLDGGIDGTKIAPFDGAYGKRYIVQGRDLARRPIFEIDRTGRFLFGNQAVQARKSEQ